MIRILVIGRDSPSWAQRLGERLPHAEVESAKLPAAGIRAFERSPADVVLLCGATVLGKLQAVVDTLRAQPLGGVLPFVAVTDDPLDGVDVQLDQSSSAAEVVQEVFAAIGIDPAEVATAPPEQPLVAAPPPRTDQAPGLSASDIERKRGEVRHGTYYAVLELAADASAAQISAAFAAMWRRFEVGAVPHELEQTLADELAEVRDGLEDAYAVLGNERLRAAYLEPRRRQQT